MPQNILQSYIDKYISNTNPGSKPTLSPDLQEEIFTYLDEVQLSNSKLNKAKYEALIMLLNISRKYSLGCSELSLVKDEDIVSKKLQHVKEASTVADIKLIMGKPEIYTYGGEIVPKHKWVLPDEEVMLWSKTSLIAPLSDEGFKRYMKLFEELFPKEYAKIH